ncbi:prepilin-type N-terminal cleavage/methylation domain-containing protein [Eubacterium ruminantium]|nr:prepilin-type N-terminal cleavage/methylation domain-containing protein [Eubacterium ruminantium]
MILNKKKNKGFTLVELMVALAVLALLIVAVVTFMSHESVILRKEEADIAVQNSAQETYNELADIIVQANYIKIEAYCAADNSVVEFSKKDVGKAISNNMGEYVITKKSLAAGGLNFEDNGYNISNGGAGDSTFYLMKTVKAGGTATTTFSNLYLKRLTVKYSVPYDSAFKGSGVGSDLGVEKDTCTAEIFFDKNKIYISKQYDLMTRLNTVSGMDDENLYSTKLNYAVTSDGKNISAVHCTVDANSQSIRLSMDFADNGFGYTVDGMINIRNSNVFIDPK